MLDHQVQEPGELALLSGQVGVEQGVVPLAPAPQHVVGAAHAVGGLQDVADLGGGHREDLRDPGWWPHPPRTGGGRTGWPSPTTGAPRSAPCGRAPRRPWRPVGRTSRRSLAPAGAMSRSWKLKNGVPSLAKNSKAAAILCPGALHRVDRRVVPRPVEGPVAEDVRPGPHEAVPVADGHAEVVLHPPPRDDPVGVVPAVGQRVVAVGSRVTHRADALEELRGVGHGRDVTRGRHCAPPHHRVGTGPTPPAGGRYRAGTVRPDRVAPMAPAPPHPEGTTEDATDLPLPADMRQAVRSEVTRVLRPPFETLLTVAVNGALMSSAWFFLPPCCSTTCSRSTGASPSRSCCRAGCTPTCRRPTCSPRTGSGSWSRSTNPACCAGCSWPSASSCGASSHRCAWSISFIDGLPARPT